MSPPASEQFVERAAAKVNLTLQVKGKHASGYHELESLVLFADFGDRLEYRPGTAYSLNVDGPFAGGVDIEGNLVERAALAFFHELGRPLHGAFQLTKRLPVAAGLGGGSSDAAAALRLLRQFHGVPSDLSDLIPMASRLGADVPCCLLSRASLMSGIGEKLQILPPLAPLPAILVNPMAPLATRDVFHTLSARVFDGRPTASPPPDLPTPEDVSPYAAERKNDLETPARALLPVIGEMLELLEQISGTRLARLSGSGATCFALFTHMEEAQRGAERIIRAHPDWWVQAVQLS